MKSTDGLIKYNTLTFNIVNGTQVLLLHTEISLKYLMKNFPSQIFNIVRILDEVFPYNSTFYYDVTGYMNGNEVSNVTADDFN